MKKGIYNIAKEARFLSIDLLRNIVRECGDCVSPHAVSLACGLLESLSSLESSRLVYLQQQTHTDRLSHVENAESKVESIRLQAAKHSPMQETLDAVIKFIGVREFQDAVPKLAAVLKRGVGLATRVASATFAQALMDKFDTVDSKPHAQTILRALEGGVRDPQSSAVRKAYARAAASTIRRAKTGTIRKFLAFLTDWAWNGNDNEGGRGSGPISSGSGSDRSAAHAGQVLHMIVRYAPKATKRFQSEFVPVAFVLRQKSAVASAEKKRKNQSGGAKANSNAQGSASDVTGRGEDAWEAVWELCVPSTPAGMRLFSKEIIKVGILPSLNSSHWAVKQKAGLAIQEIADTLAASELDPHCAELVRSLDAALSSSRGLWAGKEDLVLAFAAILRKCGDAATEVFPLHKFSDILANEARKASRDGALEYAVREGFSGAKQGNRTVVLEGGGSANPQSARYIRHIFASFQNLAGAFPAENFWNVARPAVLRVVQPVATMPSSLSVASPPSGSETESVANVEISIPPVLQVRGLECLGRCWKCPEFPEVDTSSMEWQRMQADAQICADAAVRGPWSVTVAALGALERMFGKLSNGVFAAIHTNEATGNPSRSTGLAAGLKAIDTALASLKFSKVRVAAIAAGSAFASCVKEASEPSVASVSKAGEYVRAIVALRHDNVPAVAAAATRATDAFREKQMLPEQKLESASQTVPEGDI